LLPLTRKKVTREELSAPNEEESNEEGKGVPAPNEEKSNEVMREESFCSS
jgi:hypothetical protein